MLACQYIIALSLAWGFFYNLYIASNGRGHYKTTGFVGVLAVICVYAAFVVVYIKAGAFSALWGGQ